MNNNLDDPAMSQTMLDLAHPMEMYPGDHWVLQDANYNVLGLVARDGKLVERYEYSPYGERKVFVSAGNNDAGCYAPTLVSWRRTMYTMVGGMYDNPVSVPDQPFGLCEFGHQGLPHEEEIDSESMIQNRDRIIVGGQYIQRDKLNQNIPGGGYHDGMNLYQMLRGNPINRLDPSGFISSPYELAEAFAWHWYWGMGRPFTEGAEGLKTDSGVKTAAKNEVVSFHSQICKDMRSSDKTYIEESFHVVIKPQPKSWWLIRTTNIPSRGFLISSRAKATEVKGKDGSCACRSTHRLTFSWRDEADMHPGKDIDVLFWGLSQIELGHQYSIDISWSNTARITDGNPWEVAGWPMQ